MATTGNFCARKEYFARMQKIKKKSGKKHKKGKWKLRLIEKMFIILFWT
jgi:hypothetical protein